MRRGQSPQIDHHNKVLLKVEVTCNVLQKHRTLLALFNICCTFRARFEQKKYVFSVERFYESTFCKDHDHQNDVWLKVKLIKITIIFDTALSF